MTSGFIGKPLPLVRNQQKRKQNTNNTNLSDLKKLRVQVELHQRLGKLPQKVLEDAADVVWRLSAQIDTLRGDIQIGADLLHAVLHAVDAVNTLKRNGENFALDFANFSRFPPGYPILCLKI